MLQEALDFREESDALYAILKDLDDADFAAPTQFKGWTLNDVLEHLHMWNWAANESAVDEDNFVRFLSQVMEGIANGSMKAFERQWVDGLSGHALLDAWHGFYTDMAARFVEIDPKRRLKWAGPDMSARSSISARLMETWAHGQEVFDHLGIVRRDGDRIRAIAVLGTNTFGWTYATREETPPGPMPYVRLTAPSGDIWEFGDPSNSERVEGAATDFCQVVTQVRNIADVDLQVTGAVAQDWMSKAQCFAGPPETPPAPGTRFTRAV
ncbi:MAG: TIGR03084 family metal-binding protein [Parvibaculales bacterium]